MKYLQEKNKWALALYMRMPRLLFLGPTWKWLLPLLGCGCDLRYLFPPKPHLPASLLWLRLFSLHSLVEYSNAQNSLTVGTQHMLELAHIAFLPVSLPRDESVLNVCTAFYIHFTSNSAYAQAFLLDNGLSEGTLCVLPTLSSHRPNQWIVLHFMSHSFFCYIVAIFNIPTNIEAISV